MVLMRKCGMDLDNESLQTLLRFLVHSDHNDDLKYKLIRRMYTDKAIKISHLECIALTTMLNTKLQFWNRHLKVATPIYKSQNYLFVFPEAHKKVRYHE